MIKAIILALLMPMAMFAAEQTITMNVKGNCKMCQKKIVLAAEKVDGVDEADWDRTTKVFTATFDDKKTSKAEITKAILAAGYDVEDEKSNEGAYNNLPDCCQYRDNTHDD